MKLFITGTDTGVGKTLVTALLALKLRQVGRSVGVCKPFASGAIWNNGALESEDAVWLKSVLDLPQSLEKINPITLEEPLTPLVAARRAGISTRDWRERARDAIDELATQNEIVLVEGVGGLDVPIGEDETGIWMARDFALALDCPLIIVARRALGTLNHTLLSLRAAPQAAALVFNDAAPVDAEDVAVQTNVQLLREMTGLPIWGEIPFLGVKRNDAATLEKVAASLELSEF